MQVEFITWCHFYYNVNNSEDDIPQNIIDDDELLDNYLFKKRQRAKLERIKATNRANSKSKGKVSNRTNDFDTFGNPYDPNDIY